MLLACFCVQMSAQVKAGDIISGQVWDDFDPLMMCNVVEVDHNNRIVAHGTTDINGNFLSDSGAAYQQESFRKDCP